jgi:hypothetical protein
VMPNIGVSATVQVKPDTDFAHGVVHVRLAYASGLDTDTTVTDAVDLAVERWKEIWGAAGVELALDKQAITSDGALPFPKPSNAALREASRGIAGEVVLLVGDTIGGSTDYYGYAGGIPGSLFEGGRSGVELAWETCAGTDLEFSDDDIELMAETMAHEVGHFQGLLHPVESSYDAFDSLGDTPECHNASACESALGTNLMFPYSICSQGQCVDATVITPEQGGVMHRYTGTL